MSDSSVCSILDLPDGILVKIILYFNARERLALGNSCRRFNDLVFGDEVLLRNLDFTREWQLVKESDIQQYFNNEITYKKIRRINTEQVEAVSNLSSSIGKAMNLVELNILCGLRFETVEELSNFLKPLVHLKRLSFNWPECREDGDYDNPDWKRALEEPFSRLTYLSLRMSSYSNEFLLILQLCQQLEELRMCISYEVIAPRRSSRREPMKLSNLKCVQLKVTEHSGFLRNDFMSIFQNPAEWTDFHLNEPFQEIHLERNVKVCAELREVKYIPRPTFVSNSQASDLTKKLRPLVDENLLSEAIRVTHEDAPEKFCCLSRCPTSTYQPHLLEIDDAKKLLEDPGYQISFLCLSHAIEQNCDVHLVASAFPNLTKLALLSSIRNKNSPEKTEPLRRCLRKKGSLASEEHSDARNMDSSFKMLVENTPLLKVLMIFPGRWEQTMEYWDLDALYLISRWKNLTDIRLFRIPLKDGKFLIDIGRECKKLEHVTLYYLDPSENGCFESELLQMLQHCKNLRKFSIRHTHLEHLYEMFNVLSNSSRLVDLDLGTKIKDCDSLKLVSSVEKMLRQCQQLNKFSIDIYPHQFYYELQLAVERIISELNRPDFQFNPMGPIFDYENSSNAFFYSHLGPFPRW